MTQTALEALKPCPFCGGTALRVETYDVQPDNYHSGYVTCGDCDCQGAKPDTWLSSKSEAESAAIAAWNTRAALTAPVGLEVTYSQAEFDEAHEIGKREGYDSAVQDIDMLTGGDGEYRYCLGAEDSERHTPDAESMKARIVERFEALPTQPNVTELVEVLQEARNHISDEDYVGTCGACDQGGKCECKAEHDGLLARLDATLSRAKGG